MRIIVRRTYSRCTIICEDVSFKRFTCEMPLCHWHKSCKFSIYLSMTTTLLYGLCQCGVICCVYSGNIRQRFRRDDRYSRSEGAVMTWKLQKLIRRLQRFEMCRKRAGCISLDLFPSHLLALQVHITQLLSFI
jgi:hypothetical protein